MKLCGRTWLYATTVRTDKAHRCGNRISVGKGLSTDFTRILPISTIIVVDEMVRGATERTYRFFGHGLSISALNRFLLVDVWSRILYQKREVNALFICKPPINQGFKGF